MKTKVSKLLVVACICIPSFKSKSATFQQTLAAYCVPKSGANCTGNARAKFTGQAFVHISEKNNILFPHLIPQSIYLRNYCECPVEDYYYDKSDRSCKLCADGTYSRDSKAIRCSKIPCPVGTIWVKVNKCPVGSIKSADF